MPYVTSIERRGIEKGRQQGLLEGIESVLEIRFASSATDSSATLIMARIRQISSVELLEKILQASKTTKRPEDLAAIWDDLSE